MACASVPEDSDWATAMVEYEGYPLALRVRSSADTPEHRTRWPYLAAVTQALAKVRPNGLPDPDYNEGLAEFDHEVISSLQGEGKGIVALVETFAGKRTYYAYVADPGFAAVAVERLRHSYPQHQLEARTRHDPNWGLYADYRSRWPW